MSFETMRSEPQLPPDMLLAIGSLSVVPPLPPFHYDHKRGFVVDARGACFLVPHPEKGSPPEDGTDLHAKALFDARDAGRYAELLLCLQPSETRQAWQRIISQDLAAAASYRRQVRRKVHRIPIGQQGDRESRKVNHRHMARRGFNPKLDTVNGREALLQECAGRASTLSPLDVQDLKAVAEDGAQARQQLIERNTPLVFMAAMQVRDARLCPWNIRLAAGYEGLERAVESYNQGEFAFSTYALQTIAGYMLIASRRRMSEQMNTTPSVMGRIIWMRREQARLLQELHREPTDLELAKRMNVLPRSIAKYKKIIADNRHISLDALTNDRRSGHETIASRDYSQSDAEASATLRKTLHHAFVAAELTDNERYVLQGMAGIEPFTSPQEKDALAAELGIKPAEVVALFSNAQQKLLSSPAAATILHQHIRP